MDPAKTYQHFLVILELLLFVNAQKCSEKHFSGIQSSKINGDNGFYIWLNGNPEAYKPGATYTVRIQGEKYQFSQKHFRRFILSTENQNGKMDSGSGGTFLLFGDIHTRFSDHCTNTVIETSSDVEKLEIQVMWKAPVTGAGCVTFKAAVLEYDDIWSENDGRLSFTLCEEKNEEEDMNVVQAECCACEEAKYEIMFQGLWSKETHPRDFPTSEWLLHFSDLIGASHDVNYRVWEPGRHASKGLTEVAKWGSPRVLESELKAESRHIRTIIKARGLWHPNVQGKTFAIFRTDSRNHLVSVVSMLGPSPDWIVGASALEMCLANCTWLDYKELYLYPWDAGVDSGISYESPDKQTLPSQPIKRITTQDPLDENNPFYKAGGGPMKPLAKLVIQKLREYKKSCNELDETYLDFEDSINFPDNPMTGAVGCETSEWGKWSGCSVTCGKGINQRSRSYQDPAQADINGCDLQMIQREMCSAEVPKCSGSSFYKSAPSDWIPDDTCATTEWSDWSSCSSNCHTGFKARTRRFFNRLGRKKCPHVDTVMKQTCQGTSETCAGHVEEVIPESCPVTEWSNWSPCSQSCGGGLHVRTRLYRVDKEKQLTAGCSVQLLQKDSCIGADSRCDDDNGMACTQQREVGPCRGTFKRWYYDTKTKQCQEFYFGGCRGNSNNFFKYEDCVRRCHQEANPDYQVHDMYLNDGFRNALDVLVKKRRQETADNMNEGFVEIEEQKQVIQDLEMEEKNAAAFGHNFDKMDELNSARKKLMMMEKHRMMGKQMMMFKQKQQMMMKQKQKIMSLQRPALVTPNYQSLTGISNTTKDQDCVVTSWSPWSVSCSTTCGQGHRVRFRSVTTLSHGSGRPCPDKLERYKRCRLPSCPVDHCDLVTWSEWGACSATCGSSGIQTRERKSSDCQDKAREERVCLLPCCRTINGKCVDKPPL